MSGGVSHGGEGRGEDLEGSGGSECVQKNEGIQRLQVFGAPMVECVTVRD
jgi:hypothetical protein